MTAVRQVRLRFAAGTLGIAPSDLSAVCRDGSWLWLAGDEEPQLERFTYDAQDSGSYGEHRSFRLGEFIDLPEGPDTEVDVEGLDRQGDYLWVVGSHSRSRKQADPDDSDSKAVRNLAKVRDHPNRHVLLRLPISDSGDGAVPVREATTTSGKTVSAARLADGPTGLVDLLATDEHLAPFLSIPGKDNGFDIEGVVALGEQILLGLRGPVLRGWAVVVELELQADPSNPSRLLLAGSPPHYRKLFLDLDGLGIRDLCRLGDDLVVLAGPTMDLDGPVRLYRWHGAVQVRDSDVVRGPDLTRIVELTYGEGEDHAEGVTLLPDGEGQTEVLVVYDSPAAARKVDEDSILADIVIVPA